jgi:nicotinamidase-related amidase
LLPENGTGYASPLSETAVLAVDMLNAYRHEDAELLVPNVADIIDPLAGLITNARERDDIVRTALEGERPDLVKPIVPDKDSRFLAKEIATAADCLD